MAKCSINLSDPLTFSGLSSRPHLSFSVCASHGQSIPDRLRSGANINTECSKVEQLSSPIIKFTGTLPHRYSWHTRDGKKLALESGSNLGDPRVAGTTYDFGLA